MELIGLYGGPVRAPLLPLDALRRRELRSILIEAEILKHAREGDTE